MITLQKKIHEGLNIRNILLAAQGETCLDGILIVDDKGAIEFYNRLFLELWDLTPEMVRSKSHRDLMRSVMLRLVDPEGFLARIEYLHEHHEEQSRDELALKDGRAIDHYSTPIAGPDGNYLGRIWYSRDVTERTTAYKTLTAIEERFRALVEKSSDSIVVFDADARIKYVSPAVLRASGFTFREMTSQDAFAGCHPEDVPEARRILEQLLQDPATPRSFRLRRRSKDGSWRWVEGIATNLIAEPSVQGIVVDYQDISERKKAEEILQKAHDELEEKVRERTLELERELAGHERAEEALRRSEKRFSTIFKAGPLAISISRLSDGFIFDVNDTFLSIFGYGRDEVVGRSSLDLNIWPSTEDRAQFIRLVRESHPRTAEVRLRNKAGSILYAFGSATIIESGGEQCLLSMFSDNTDRKRAEKEKNAYEEALRSLASQMAVVQERERQRIAAGLHDHIGQALAMARLKLGELRESGPDQRANGLAGEVKKYIDEAVQYTRSLTFELSPPVLHELGLVAALEWLAEQLHNQHGVEIIVEAERRPLPAKEEAQLVLFNAVRESLINTVKHARAKKAEISMGSCDGTIRILVEDDGIGFDPSTIRPFGKAGGFGLFYSGERLKSIGGRFEIKSAPGQGTQVAITAPLKR